MCRLFVCWIACIVPVCAQFETKLQPQTVQEFDQYARTIEQQLEMRRHGSKPFFSIDDNSSDRETVMHGELLIQPGAPNNPIPISDGLIHDWIGAVFMPNTTMARVLQVLQNFDDHSKIYPSVIRSRLIRRDGNNLVGYWRLQWKNALLAVTLDVEQQARYEEVAPGEWICKAYANNISEVDRAGSASERKFPPGEGEGFLWRLYAYWSLKTVNGGVLGECRTLSLTRSVPGPLTWAIKPFLQNLPRESLSGTLRDTRRAATQ